MFSESQASLHDPQVRHGNMMPHQFAQSSANRSNSLQPFPRTKSARPRKSSISESARKGKHERQRSKDQKRASGDRKALSAEPSSLAAQVGGKRWEDLLDAAASATEEDSRDLTPVRHLLLVETSPQTNGGPDTAITARVHASLPRAESQSFQSGVIQYVPIAKCHSTSVAGARPQLRSSPAGGFSLGRIVRRSSRATTRLSYASLVERFVGVQPFRLPVSTPSAAVVDRVQLPHASGGPLVLIQRPFDLVLHAARTVAHALLLCAAVPDNRHAAYGSSKTSHFNRARALLRRLPSNHIVDE